MFQQPNEEEECSTDTAAFDKKNHIDFVFQVALCGRFLSFLCNLSRDRKVKEPQLAHI